ncbi:MAG: RHS repeat-associated core domain-containing protein [Bacteroidota bacterium]
MPKKNAKHILFGDFNGDGNTDILSEDIDGQWTQSLSTGSDLVNTNISNPFGLSSNTSAYFVGDINGDGKFDLLSLGSFEHTQQKGIFIGFGSGSGLVIDLNNTFYKSWVDEIVQEENYLADFDGDGSADLNYYGYATSNRKIVKFYSNINHMFVNSMANGLNAINEIEYKPLTDPTVYTKGSGSIYPVMDFQVPMYVVKSISSPDGIGTQSTTSYNYSGLKLHLKGRGLLGFIETSNQNSASGIKQTSLFRYNEAWCLQYPYLMSTYSGDNTLLSDTKNVLSVIDLGDRCLFPYDSLVISTDYLTNTRKAIETDYNNFGNLCIIKSYYGAPDNSSSFPSTIIEGNSIKNLHWTTPVGGWQPNRLEGETSIQSRVNEADISRTTLFTYNNKWKVSTIRQDPNDANEVQQIFDYDNTTGVLVEKSEIVNGANPRMLKYVYDINNRFAEKISNSLDQFVMVKHDPITGFVHDKVDINGLITSYHYDNFGRINAIDRPDAVTESSSITWVNNPIFPNAIYSSQSSIPGTPSSVVYFDLLGREVGKEIAGFDGSPVYTQTHYNNLGQKIAISDPYFSNEQPQWTTYTYNLGRITLVDSPTEDIAYEYNGRTITTRKISVSPNQVATKTIDAMGLPIVSIDAGGQTSYDYFSSGLPKKIVASDDAITLMEYNLQGKQTKLIDPDAGEYSYQYNAFGELISQTNPNFEVTQLSYDDLGRLQTLHEPDMTSDYIYDNSPHGIGKLSEISNNDGSSITYGYDEFGRPNSTTETVDNIEFTELVAYDNFGRMNRLVYPSGFGINYQYNAYNYLQQINRVDDQTMIWKINSLNSRFQILNSTSGNQLQTNKNYYQGNVTDIITGNVQNMHYEWNLGTGNLSLRNDIKHNLQESFSYDNLDRLTQIVPSNNSAMSIAYQENGNIDYSTTAGTYYYTGSQPHAATIVTDPGNIISDNPQEVEYTSFNKVKRILEDINELKISYGVNHERNKEEFYENSTLSKTRYFSHGNYETEITGTNERKLNYISSPDGVIAVYEMNNEVGAMYYIHKDHLGSWQVITDQAGHAIQEQSFDTWGRRRNPDNWTYNNINPVQKFHRGYTGHEQLDQFSLINMNGRMYDPATARFLSPDISVQNPEFSQSYNKYSYCVNNPLKYTDPSGWYLFQYKHYDDPKDYYNYMSTYWSQFTNFSSFNGGSGGGGSYSNSPSYMNGDGSFSLSYLMYIQRQNLFNNGFVYHDDNGYYKFVPYYGIAGYYTSISWEVTQDGEVKFFIPYSMAIYESVQHKEYFDQPNGSGTWYKEMSNSNNYPGIRIFESNHVVGGFTLPRIGIFVENSKDIPLIQHEYGHYLNYVYWQSIYGTFFADAAYGIFIAGPSAIDMEVDHLFGTHTHANFYPERWADNFAEDYFGNDYKSDYKYKRFSTYGH